ncbi:MAG: PAS domain S-box protein [Chloroflexaceae bacterium]|nr:PAS domain S-box protein [Chloroflexaceae bacterium]
MNITERKRTEQQLQRYADLIETTSDYIAMADSAGNTLYINQAGRQMQGYAADMPVSAMGVQRSHPDWVLNIMAEQAIPTAMREGTWHGETAIIDHCTGDEIPVSQVVLAHRSPDGQFDFFSTIMRDISERKRFEAELRTSEERFRNIVHHANEIIYTLSPDGRFTFVSPAWTRLLGHAIAEVEGHSFEAFVHPDDIAACQTFLIQVLSGQNALDSVEYRVCHKDGSWRWHMSVGSLVHDEEQNILYYVGIAQDTTERRQTAEALRQAKEAAEAANNAKSAFLAHMSHELRSPLNAILGFAQLLARDATLTPSQQEHLTIIRNSGEHLLNLINDVLDMSKIEAGRITVHAHPMDLHRLTHDLVEMFQLRAMEKQLRLQIDQSSAVPAFIDADERKLRQVLINLIGNALKFTDQGNVMVRIRCITQDNEINDHVGFDRHFTQRPIPDGLRLLVEVIDTGPGIPLEEQASIFEPFKQTNNKTLSQEGTGLGLAISRQFVRLMGGHLSLESTPGSGSCFRFDLPIYESRDQQARPPVASSHVLHLAIDQPSYRVLVVEDKWTNRQLLVSLLQPLGFQVREARHGQEALHICQTWSPHLIFMDIRMPIMDGYTATRAIHALPQGQSTIIIALTASVFEEERADIMTSGCADLIRKPFRYEEIIQALEKHLGAQFIYESGPARPTQPDAVLSDAYTLTPTALQHLSRDLLETLHAAAERCSVSLVLNVIEQIEPIDANLASTLTSIVNDFHFEQLTDILQPLLWPDESTEL